MTRDELRTFCDLENVHRFQDKLCRATEADILDVLTYLLVEDKEGYLPPPKSAIRPDALVPRVH